MANQHFFKPLLPGFYTHLTIPVAFLKHVERRNEQKMAELRSDLSQITWKVKLEDGQKKLTDGWKEFALAHDLRIGDIVVFRQQRDMAFHVTLLGPSCCEIQYEQNNLEKIPKKKNLRREAESSSLDPSCFVANVSPATLRYDRLNLPMSFARANGLNTRFGEIILMNEKGKSWTLALKQKKSGGAVYIRSGWRSFCNANGLKAGGCSTFKLIQRGKTPVLRLFPKEHEEEEEEEDCSEAIEVESLSTELGSDEENNQNERSSHECSKRKYKRGRWKVSSSPSQNRLVTLTLKPSDVKNSRLYLPIPFTRMNDINEKTKMTLLDKNGVKWSTNLRSEDKGKRIRFAGGWQKFFQANYVKTGESIMFKLIWEGDTSCVLKYCSKVKPLTE